MSCTGIIRVVERGIMGKKSKKNKKDKGREEKGVDASVQQGTAPGEKPKMKNKEYEAELFKLQVELVKLQELSLIHI